MRIARLGFATSITLMLCLSTGAAQTAPATRPLTLSSVLDSVSARHPVIEAARARIRIAQGARSIAGRLRNPMLSYDIENAAFPGRDAPPMDREAMTLLTLPLEPIYQRGPMVRRANADIQAAIRQASFDRLDLMVAATEAFHRAALAQIRTTTARDVAAWLDSIVAYNTARVREGVAAEADQIRSELERDQARTEAVMREAELTQATARLAALISDSVTHMLPLAVAIDSSAFDLPEGDASSALDRALRNRPDLVAARERVASAAAGISVERRMIFRELALSFGSKQSAGTSSLMAGVSVPVPLFSQNSGDILRAQAARDIAGFELAAMRRDVQAEVLGFLLAARLLSEQVRSLTTGPPGQRLLNRAEDSRRIALGAYREGAIPLTQVIDASRAWAESRNMLFEILFAQQESILRLAVSMGEDPIHVTTRSPR